jgi:hypothetical protein
MKPILFVALPLALLVSAPARAQSSNAEFAATTLNLSATGETAVPPDRATLSLGVTAQAPTAAAAMNRNAQAMTKVFAALKAQGIADRDMRTTGLGAQPQYNFAANTPRTITGYVANNRVIVTVQDPTRVGPLIDAVAAAGANDFQGVTFGLKDPQAAEDQARLKAVRTLQARAELYAKASGYRVARLVNLSEGERTAPVMRQEQDVVVVTGSRVAPTPVSAGDIAIQVRVNATYELTK